MPKLLIRASYTAQGAQGLLRDGGTARKRAIADVLASVGGSLETLYFAFGEDDVILIADFPTNADAAAVALTVGASGIASTSSTMLLTAEEVDLATQKAVAYRPPGS
jgi:uncharacterized protein with GYD domain